MIFFFLGDALRLRINTPSLLKDWKCEDVVAVIWLPNGYFGKFHKGVPQYFIMQSPKDRKMAHTHGHSMSGAPSLVSRRSLVS